VNIKELYHQVRGIVGPAEFDRRVKNWLLRLRSEAQRPPVSTNNNTYQNDCKAVLQHLNQILGSKYQLLKNYEDMISFWLKQGKSIEDFIKVHKFKYAQWFDDPKMRPYLRPSTLYRKSHFDEYLQEAIIAKTDKVHKPDKEIIRDHKESKEHHEQAMKKIQELANLKRMNK
jgi:uncharacterized phage protein (TIGR02220 family)